MPTVVDLLAKRREAGARACRSAAVGDGDLRGRAGEPGLHDAHRGARVATDDRQGRQAGRQDGGHPRPAPDPCRPSDRRHDPARRRRGRFQVRPPAARRLRTALDGGGSTRRHRPLRGARQADDDGRPREAAWPAFRGRRQAGRVRPGRPSGRRRRAPARFGITPAIFGATVGATAPNRPAHRRTMPDRQGVGFGDRPGPRPTAGATVAVESDDVGAPAYEGATTSRLHAVLAGHR